MIINGSLLLEAIVLISIMSFSVLLQLVDFARQAFPYDP